MPNTTKYFRTKQFVYDEAGKFLACEVRPSYKVMNDAGAVINEFDGPFEPVTTEHADVAKLIGEEVVAASVALAESRAALARANDDAAAALTAAQAEAAAQRQALADDAKAASQQAAAIIAQITAERDALAARLQALGQGVAAQLAAAFPGERVG